MGTTAEKLTYLNTTKQDLKTVINTTGAGLTNESTFRSYANVLNDKILGAINGDVDLFEEYPKVSGNGTDLSLNGVVEGKMSITPQGVSSQDGEPTPTTPIPVKSVTGENSIVLQNANLLDKTTLLPKSTINGTTGEIEDYDGCGASEQYISVLPNTQYTFSCSTTMLALRVSCYNLEKEHIERKSSTSNVKSFSFLTPDDCHYVRCSFNYNNVIIVTQEVLNTLNLQVTKGSTAPTTYVEHEEQNYQLSLGNMELNSSPDGTIRDQIKGSSDVSYNLFNKNDVIKGNYQINSSHSLVSSNSNRVLFIPCKPNTAYTVSKIISNYFTIGFINEEPNVNISVTGYMRNPSLEYLTSTSDSDSKYLVCWYYNTGETLTEQEILDSIQITEGSEAKPYFPYGQVGMWYKREYIGKVVLDGSNDENWAKNSLTYYVSGDFPLTFNAQCSHFIKQPNYNWNSSNENYKGKFSMANVQGQIKFMPIDGDISSITLWRNWLSENNITVWYQKSEYTDIPITDTTLINQLNDIYNNAHSYNGVTNITTTYEEGSEQMYLDIEALKNVWDTSL